MDNLQALAVTVIADVSTNGAAITWVDGYCTNGSADHSESTDDGPLAGLSFAVKDVIDVAGHRTGAGNPTWLAGAAIATRHAQAVQALIDGGATFCGKTVADELAFSMSGINVHYGTPLNHRAPGRLPGGSSSGSASVISAGACSLALGTDTGGSIRVPASYCGLFGLRPTHGRISTKGVVPLAPSFDTVGLLASDASYLELGWRALRSKATRRGYRGPRRGRKARVIVTPLELLDLSEASQRERIVDAVESTASMLGLRHEVRGCNGLLAPLEARAAFHTLELYEAWATLGPWVTKVQPSISQAIADRLTEASRIQKSEVVEAREIRRRVKRNLFELLGDDRFLAYPSTYGPAPDVETMSPADTLRIRTQSLTSLSSMTGAPALSIPVLNISHLPIGWDLLGLPGDDDELVRIAAVSAKLF